MDLATAEYLSISEKYHEEVLISMLSPELLQSGEGSKKSFLALPIKTVRPNYPRKALLNSVQGWVRGKLVLDKSGNPRNIRVVESFPDDIFSKETVKPISEWRFEPNKNEKGEPAVALNLGYTLKFPLGDKKFGVEKSIYEEALNLTAQREAESQFSLDFWHEKLDDLGDHINPTERYLKAAIQGHSFAQYKLGQSLINGQGCRRDMGKGSSWVTRAAADGQSDAQEYLAGIALQSPSLESQKLALSHLNSAEETNNLNPSSTIRLAWLLATSPYEGVADSMRAIKLIEDISLRNYKNCVTKQEIIAGAYAAIGNFEEGVDYQDETLDDAENLNYDTSEIEEWLQAHKNKKSVINQVFSLKKGAIITNFFTIANGCSVFSRW